MINVYFKGIITLKPFTYLELKNVNAYYGEALISTYQDEKELKEGFPLSYVYAQTYIPLYAVYDFDRKEYGYVFDSRYAVEDENGTLNLNLFEMKIKDESQIKPSEQDLKGIKTNKQIKAVINVNTDQFDKKAFNYETE